jgi:threonine dehydrogenase-like Zn-dependent dehydrogenase
VRRPGSASLRERRDGDGDGAPMRAARLVAPGHVSLDRLPAVPLGAGTVRVRVEGCGVCGSGLPVWEGRPWFDYPLPPGAPGHEGWGRVLEVGTGSAQDAWSPGDRVAFLSDLAFADTVDADHRDLVAIPAVLDALPFPGEALGCACSVAARSHFEAGMSVCVVGVGFLGAVVTMLAAAAGARVVAVSRRHCALEAAARAGAADLVAFDDPARVVEEVAERTDGELCDVVVEAVGMQSTLDVAALLTKARGRLVLAGYHQDGLRQVDLQLWAWRGLDVVNAHERDRGRRLRAIRDAAVAVATGAIDPMPLYTHRYPLEALGDAMTDLGRRPEGFMKALVEP